MLGAQIVLELDGSQFRRGAYFGRTSKPHPGILSGRWVSVTP